jgi:hypothetical protein
MTEPNEPEETPRGTSDHAPLRKRAVTLPAGRTRYTIEHNLGTSDVVIQTRIAGRVREGGIAVIDENTVELVFGGVLNEPIDVVIIG